MSVSSYDAVVIGGAPHTGRRHKDARRFVRRHRRALAERPLRLFSSGPLLGLRAGHRPCPGATGHDPAVRRGSRHVRRLPGGGVKGAAARMILRSGKGRGLQGLRGHHGDRAQGLGQERPQGRPWLAL
ncbi:flavodoxin domain-containing protein [Streptomyces canus]|uniref:flavodoxin domain-containing protein n=1 Tax=Streptomyces canus TaxID=58343 RepID=UPI002E2E0687|nr:flavodoxin domain-containing protein [Streptomyces canus]